jgi:murein DD-endopeptidase MepM/ murein hydrolase activator NlpD
MLSIQQSNLDGKPDRSFVSFYPMKRLVFFVIAIALLVPPVFAQDQELVRIRSEQTDGGGFRLVVDSDHIIPVYVHLTFDRLVNLEVGEPQPVTRLIDPGATDVAVATLVPTSRTGRRGFDLSFTYARGNPATARHDDYLYLFPFAHGAKHRVTQGFNGAFTHFGENQYAVDFDLDEGTEIYAARSGLVVEVKEDSTIGGPNVRYGEHANYVLVQHDDGSFGNYVHLRLNGALVEVGEAVTAGQLIGYSGNTGRSSGPHLHFDVRLPTDDGRMRSIPMRFRGLAGEAIDPEEGLYYYAFHPGGEPFEIAFGSALSNQDFAEYRRDVDPSNELDIRTEQVDSTFVVYLSNGYTEDVEVEVSFDLRGMETSGTFPQSFVAPAKTEIFLTLVRPVAGTRQSEFAPRVRYRPPQ